MESTTVTTNTAAATFTVGVEEEYQLIDPATGALRSHATSLREGDWTGELVAEMQETTIEVGTPICSSATEARDELKRLRFQADTVAASEGLVIVAAGMHPFSGWEGHLRPPLERYQAIEARYGRIARDEHIFGMHVHVGVPEDVDRLSLINATRRYLPHLLALSASSPFVEGADTGFASFRTIMWRRWPNSGIPPRFADDAEFERYVSVLLDAGVMADPWNLYWSMRPHPKYPTVEFRVTDVCPNLHDAAAIAALCRAIILAATDGALRDELPAGMTPVLEQEILRINEWQVARDGLESRVVDITDGARNEPVRDAISRLLDDVARYGVELGDSDALGHIETIMKRGNAADRMRRRYEEAGSMEHVVAWLVQESMVGTGLDRRTAQRDGD
jgi:glutamate---cysteine ligase / carboxylate-amine ligase